jgi:ABC-type dipeptide/oligopeptide/nickel transport system ATPase component
MPTHPMRGITMTDAILQIENYSGYFSTSVDSTPVLKGVSYALPRGEMTAVVGETGSGKSLTALSILQIQPPTFVVTAGSINFDGQNMLELDERRLQRIRGARISMVFQDARVALNPVFTIGRQIADVCRKHQDLNRRDAESMAISTLRRVNIPDPERRARQYPHEFSGGMAQRAMIAMALVCRPELLVLDEPTTGLDVTIQAEIMALIRELGHQAGLTTCLITHDLGVVAETCDHVVVISRGEVVETGPCQQVMTNPMAPYTKRLLAASRLVEAA